MTGAPRYAVPYVPRTEIERHLARGAARRHLGEQRLAHISALTGESSETLLDWAVPLWAGAIPDDVPDHAGS